MHPHHIRAIRTNCISNMQNITFQPSKICDLEVDDNIPQCHNCSLPRWLPFLLDCAKNWVDTRTSALLQGQSAEDVTSFIIYCVRLGHILTSSIHKTIPNLLSSVLMLYIRFLLLLTLALATFCFAHAEPLLKEVTLIPEPLPNGKLAFAKSDLEKLIISSSEPTTSPVPVHIWAVLGFSRVGKSTLMNALVKIALHLAGIGGVSPSTDPCLTSDSATPCTKGINAVGLKRTCCGH